MFWVGAAVVAGLGLLAVASDRFVAGSAGLADRWGVSRVLIGALVIGFGTSSPELLVSGLAAADGDPDVGVGNILGSNMANLGLVVAVAALVGRVTVPRGLLRREVPLMLAATGAFALAVQNGLTRPEGAALAVALVVALTLLVRWAQRPTKPAEALAGDVGEFLADETRRSTGRLALDAVLGLLGTLAGAQLLVSGAVDIAAELDLSGGFVGMTVVALGTSLPELVTAVAAARAGEDQLIMGNVLGSNMFNCLAVGAVVGLIRPMALTDAGLTAGAVAAMLTITALGTLAMARRGTVTRLEAAGLLGAYVALVPVLAA